MKTKENSSRENIEFLRSSSTFLVIVITIDRKMGQLVFDSNARSEVVGKQFCIYLAVDRFDLTWDFILATVQCFIHFSTNSQSWHWDYTVHGLLFWTHTRLSLRSYGSFAFQLPVVRPNFAAVIWGSALHLYMPCLRGFTVYNKFASLGIGLVSPALGGFCRRES